MDLAVNPRSDDYSGFDRSIQTSNHDDSIRYVKEPTNRKKVSLQGEQSLKLGSSSRVPKTMKNSVITERVNKFMNESKDSLNMLQFSQDEISLVHHQNLN